MTGEHTMTTIRSRMNQKGTLMGAAMVLPPAREMSQKAFSPSRKVIFSIATPMMGTRLVNKPTMMAARR